MERDRRNGYVWIIILGVLMLALTIVAGVVLFSLVKPQDGKKETQETTLPPTYVPETEYSGEILSEDGEAKIKTIRGILDESYLFGTEGTDFETAMIRAYVSALGDPYTVYYTPEEFNELLQSNEGTYCGVGVSVTQDPDTGFVNIVRVFHGSPAEEAGLKSGDQIVAIEGQSIKGLDLNLAVSDIRGEEGTYVNVTIFRPSENREFKVDLIRRQVEVDSVDGRMLEGNIGYIELMGFDEPTYHQFMDYFEKLKKEGAKGFIVDIRDNPGGLLSSVANILDDLLPKGIITYTIDKNGDRDEYKSDTYDVLGDMPMVLLTNGNSASAAEIFTGALRDYGKAISVGETTFGKGIVQVILSLGDGSGLKVTIAHYFTPNGVCIHGEGIAPDVPVVDDPETEEDEVLERGIEELKKKMK